MHRKIVASATIFPKNLQNLNQERKEKMARKKDERKQIRITASNRLKEIVEKIKKEKGLTQTQIAEALGVYAGGFTQILKGKRELTFEQLNRLQKKFNVNLNYLFAPEEEKHRVCMFSDENQKQGCKKYYIGSLLLKVEEKMSQKEVFSRLNTIKDEEEYIKYKNNEETANECVIYEICAKFGITFDEALKGK